MNLRRYIGKRLLQAVPVIAVIMVLNFFIVRLAPGDPAWALAGDNAPQSYVEELRKTHGLNEPLFTQFTIYLGQLVHGDLGFSFAHRKPVLDVLSSRIYPTLLLVVSSQLLAILGGILLGTVAARYNGKPVEIVLSTFTLILYSVPVFWSGLVLIRFFSVDLGWLPSSGMNSFFIQRGTWGHFLDTLEHMALPTVALFLYTMPIYYRLTRSAVLESITEHYITTAKAIGYSRDVVFFRHALRNALLPTITVAGLSLGFILSGSLLTETVFAWPGMGRLMYDSVSRRDYPVLMGVFLFSAVCVVIASIVTDIAYAYVDPRVRYS